MLTKECIIPLFQFKLNSGGFTLLIKSTIVSFLLSVLRARLLSPPAMSPLTVVLLVNFTMKFVVGGKVNRV